MKDDTTGPEAKLTLALLRRTTAVRARLDLRLDSLMLRSDDDRFWRTFSLFQRACRAEISLIERLVAQTTGHGRKTSEEDHPRHVPRNLA